jgi:Mycoplasma protein of unknown function, DUF285
MIQLPLLERVRVLSHSLTSARHLFSACAALQTVEIDTSGIEDFSNCFSYCTSLRSIPEINTSSGTTFLAMFAGCSGLLALPPLDTSNGIDFRVMFAWSNDYAGSLPSIPLLDTRKGEMFEGMFAGCSLRSVPRLDLSGLRGEISFSNARALARIEVVGLGAANSSVQVGLNDTNLGAAALNAFYANLEPITSPGFLYVANTPGPLDPDHDPTLATSKGWTIYY